MPGHSLIQINGVYKIYVGLEIANILQKLPPLLDKFFDFAANHPQQNQLRPRDWIAASSGGRDGHHHKTIVSHLAAILESLQRYAVPNARQANSPPAPSYQPGQGWGSTDHDLIVQLLKDLWTELTNKPNPGGGFSAAPGFPAGPPMAGGAYTQPGYDQ